MHVVLKKVLEHFEFGKKNYLFENGAFEKKSIGLFGIWKKEVLEFFLELLSSNLAEMVKVDCIFL